MFRRKFQKETNGNPFYYNSYLVLYFSQKN